MLSEAPSFFTTLLNWEHAGLHIHGVPLGPHGLALAAVDARGTLGGHPRLMLVAPDHHNPTGLCWPAEARHAFLKWAAERALTVVEDATYRDLRLEGPELPPLAALDREVLYVGAFSKSLIPGIRVGFVVARGPLREQLITLKQLTTSSGESYGQRALAEFLLADDYAPQLERVTRLYRQRRDALLEALLPTLPDGTRWRTPQGGFYVWLDLRPEIDANAIFRRALERGLVLFPASVNALFASFVVIQFQYFFGGDHTLEVAGLTYADYARRGFFELVVVAMLTLGLALTLRAVTRLSLARANQLFNGLCLLLVALTDVLLASAFQRLWFYEDAYGFTRLRTYAHGFIIWLGVALLVFLVTTLAQRPRLFLFGALACGLGFVITLNFFSTDAFITRENIARGTLLTSSTIETLTGRYEARSVDTAYLATLSADAVPDLVAALEHPDPEIRAAVRAVVDARIAAFDPDSFGPDRWPSWNYARLRAAELLAAAQGVVP